MTPEGSRVTHLPLHCPSSTAPSLSSGGQTSTGFYQLPRKCSGHTWYSSVQPQKSLGVEGPRRGGRISEPSADPRLAVSFPAPHPTPSSVLWATGPAPGSFPGYRSSSLWQPEKLSWLTIFSTLHPTHRTAYLGAWRRLQTIKEGKDQLKAS